MVLVVGSVFSGFLCIYSLDSQQSSTSQQMSLAGSVLLTTSLFATVCEHGTQSLSRSTQTCFPPNETNEHVPKVLNLKWQSRYYVGGERPSVGRGTNMTCRAMSAFAGQPVCMLCSMSERSGSSFCLRPHSRLHSVLSYSWPIVLHSISQDKTNPGIGKWVFPGFTTRRNNVVSQLFELSVKDVTSPPPAELTVSSCVRTSSQVHGSP
eukprot:3299890-Amphidinium_carterae.1